MKMFHHEVGGDAIQRIVVVVFFLFIKINLFSRWRVSKHLEFDVSFRLAFS